MQIQYFALAAASLRRARAMPAAAQTAKAALRHLGLELKDMDPSVKPGDDFFEYAEGTWLKNHPIPADKTAPAIITSCPTRSSCRSGRWSRTCAANPTIGRSASKIGDAYAALDGRGRDRSARHSRR